MMSDSTFIIGIIAIIVASPAIILLIWLLYRNSILFKMFFAFAIPLDLCALFGYIIGYKGLIHLTWAIPVLIVTFLLALAYLQKEMVKPTVKIRDAAGSLQQGNMNVIIEEKYLKGKDEVSQAMQMLGKLTDTLKRVVAFANNIGKGDLTSEITPANDHDEIAIAMLGMRDNLQAAEKEKEKRQEDDEKRNWVTVGLAKFAEILRTNNDNLQELSYIIISNLVKYTGANQAAIFILNNEDASHPVLEMTACYAYERRKFTEKTVELGEGLVGTCFMERESIYMTQVPQDYIRITSGLGDENPGVLFLTPLKVNEEIYGVIEIAAFTVFEPHVKEFIEKAAESIASTIGSVKIHIQTNKLLEMSKMQAEEMANQEEELRQNMEEMQATQEESRRRESEMKLYLDAVYKSTLVLEYDTNRRVTYINDKFLTLNNMTREQVLGASFHDFIKDEYDLNGQSFEEMWKAVLSGEGRNSVMHLPLLDGRVVTLDAYFMPIPDEYGKTYKVMVISTVVHD